MVIQMPRIWQRALQADVTVIDQSVDRLRALSGEFAGRIKVLMATQDNIANAVGDADLVIGAGVVPGASTPKLISRCQLKDMLPGAVLVDIAIDQGGAFELAAPQLTTRQPMLNRALFITALPTCPALWHARQPKHWITSPCPTS